MDGLTPAPGTVAGRAAGGLPLNRPAAGGVAASRLGNLTVAGSGDVGPRPAVRVQAAWGGGRGEGEGGLYLVP
jgi:hypothetical protein